MANHFEAFNICQSHDSWRQEGVGERLAGLSEIVFQNIRRMGLPFTRVHDQSDHLRAFK